ncbi:MAG: hypothetical protein ACYCV7_12825 [Acidimicrobiales bacterium]
MSVTARMELIPRPGADSGGEWLPVATAIAHGATLLIGDPEILDGDPAWPVEDLRS